MLTDDKKASRRLTSLFSLSSPSEPHDRSPATNVASVPSSESSGGRLAKVKKRMTSATYLAPTPTPPALAATTRHASLAAPTDLPVVPIDAAAPPAPPASAAWEPLEPPPPLDAASRSSSPYNSRPGTPSSDAGGEGGRLRLRRKSRLFGGSPGSGSGVSGAGSPQAWIVGHQGKVAYSLTALLQGERVRCYAWPHCRARKTLVC